MRRALTTLTFLAIFSAGCSSITTSGLSNGGQPKRHDAGNASTGGAAPGTPCDADAVCGSNVCGLTGTGNCCARACATGDATCGATGCDDAGACLYPPGSLDCGASSCSEAAVVQPQCDGFGSCWAESLKQCPSHTGCDDAGAACAARCSSSAECADGYSCNTGLCAKPEPGGPCTENDDCMSGVCGGNGSGQCCASSCLGGTCGASDCDPNTGACIYPGTDVPCGEPICDGGIYQPAPACNAFGGCEIFATEECMPFACNPSGCRSTCKTNADCAEGYCDVPSGSCCGLASGAQIDVDSVSGKDAQTCCGSPASPCQTITHAMQLIDAAQARDVIVTASVKGSTPAVWSAPEKGYPIVLGWGVELSAYGVSFFDGDAGSGSVFEIGPVSPNDHVGYASVVGSVAGAESPGDRATILVDPGWTLYAAGNWAYSSWVGNTSAIEVSAGASLVLGQDHSGVNTATVVIGALRAPALGFNGILCDTANGLGCTITDVSPDGGGSSVIMTGQGYYDIDAEDFASITLTGQPQIGMSPSGPGHHKCQSLVDGELASDAAILLHGKANLTIANGAIECIAGTAIALEASGNGVPKLSLDRTVIEDTAVGVDVLAGTATISNSTIEYNGYGVEQDTDGMNLGVVDLSGGAVGGTNIVACNTTGNPTPGASVVNLTSQPLNASNVDWDTAGPDVFSCNPLTSCTCQSSTCADTPGADGMDAVTEIGGAIQTAGNGLASACVP